MPPKPRPIIDRLLARCIEGGDGCWLFTGALHHGYGKISRWPSGNGWAFAHRVAYEYFVAPIPEGLQLDHLCRVPRCVNPWHLEPVPPAVNTRRGEGWLVGNAIRLSRTHCKWGHPYDYVKADGARGCTECRRRYVREYRARQRSTGLKGVTV